MSEFLDRGTDNATGDVQFSHVTIDPSFLRDLSEKHEEHSEILLFEKPTTTATYHPLQHISLACSPETNESPLQIAGNIIFEPPQAHLNSSVHSPLWHDSEQGYSDVDKAVAVIEDIHAYFSQHAIQPDELENELAGIRVTLAEELRIDIRLQLLGESVFNVETTLVPSELGENLERSELATEYNMRAVQSLADIWMTLQEIITRRYSTEQSAPTEVVDARIIDTPEPTSPTLLPIEKPAAFEKIAGYQNQISALQRFHALRTEIEIAKEFGTHPHVGMVLHGAEGNGKMTLAESFAQSIHAEIRYLDVSQFNPQYLQHFFDFCLSQNEPNVVLIDNMQLINLEMGGYPAHFYSDALQRFIAEIHDKPQLTLIGMATQTDGIDRKLFKPGSFDTLAVSPTKADIAAMLGDLVATTVRTPNSPEEELTVTPKLNIDTHLPILEIAQLCLRKGLTKGDVKSIFGTVRHNAFVTYMTGNQQPITISKKEFIDEITAYTQQQE